MWNVQYSTCIIHAKNDRVLLTDLDQINSLTIVTNTFLDIQKNTIHNHPQLATTSWARA